MTVSGSVGSGTHDIQARFNQGTWVTIAVGATGTYSGVLSNQFQGQGYVQTRWADAPNATVAMPNVGIGEVFVVAGQSNGSGRGTNPESTNWDRPIPFVSLFGNDYTWKLCTDPTDSVVNQVDAVSDDGAGKPKGSVWPFAGSLLAQRLGLPIAFVPCAMSGSFIADWAPSGGATNRSSLYGSMLWRAKYQVGGARAVLLWDGESDAQLGTSQATFYSGLTNLSTNVHTDLGCKVMPCKLQACTNASAAAGEPAINAAIAQAWAGDANTIQGPDLNVIDTTPDDLHLITDAKVQQAATLWYNAIIAAYGW